MTTTVTRDVKGLQKSVENMDAANPERIGSPSLGDVVRQGDLYLVCVESAEGEPTDNRQLAPGTTQGSRHVAVGNVVVRRGSPLADVPEELRGPSMDCLGETTIAHPEHGDKILPAGTSWGIVYQRAFAEEIRRVQD